MMHQRSSATIVQRLFVFVYLACSGCCTCFAASNNTDPCEDEVLIREIVNWIRSNGGWISKKVEVKQIVGALSGIFSTDSIEDGEVLVEIPWDLILKPNDLEEDDWCDKVENVRQSLIKEPALQNPYERYLATRSRDFIPLFWSSKSKSLLLELMDGFSHEFQIDVESDWHETCDVPADDAHLNAMMILQTRGEGEYIDLLIPFGDLPNHRNGAYTNIDPEIEQGKSAKLVATRAIQAGEQLHNSYNQCPWCVGLYSNPTRPSMYENTPQLFELYGFVEWMPQRWVIPGPRIIFDITKGGDDSGEELEVNFVAPISRAGVRHLQARLVFLEEFEESHEDRTDILEQELEAIFNFHRALRIAFSWALREAVGKLSEEVWHLKEDEWHLERSEDGNDNKDEL